MGNDTVTFGKDGTWKRSPFVAAMDINESPKPSEQNLNEQGRSSVRTFSAPEVPKEENSTRRPGTFNLSALRAQATKSTHTVSETTLPKQNAVEVNEFKTVNLGRKEEEPTEVKPVVLPDPVPVADDNVTAAEGESAVQPEPETETVTPETVVAEEDSVVAAEQPAEEEVIIPESVGEVSETEPEHEPYVRETFSLGAIRSVARDNSVVKEESPESEVTEKDDFVMEMASVESGAYATEESDVAGEEVSSAGCADEPADVTPTSSAPAVEEMVLDAAPVATGTKFEIVSFEAWRKNVSMEESTVVSWCKRCMNKFAQYPTSVFCYDKEETIRFYRYFSSGSRAVRCILGHGDYACCVQIDTKSGQCTDMRNSIRINDNGICGVDGVFYVLFSSSIKSAMRV